MTVLSSLRGRLAAVSAIIITAVLAFSGLGLAWLFENYLERRIGQELESRVLDLAGAFELSSDGKPVITQSPADPRYRNPYSGLYWYVREGKGFALRSRSLWDAEIQSPAPATGAVERGEGPEGSSVYLLERPLSLGENAAQRDFILGVAVDTAEVTELAQSFRRELMKGLALVGSLLFVAAWLQASYGLRPLRKIRDELVALRRGETDRLTGPFPDEIKPLAQDLNALFARQRDMIAKARERAGSLAHALKTPMTVLYGEIDKLERQGNKTTARFMRDQIERMHNQVERELARARAHGVSTGLGVQADVSATAARIVDLMKRMPRGNTLVWHLPQAGLSAAIDADDLGEVLGNLLDNARKCARSTVMIEAQQEHGRLRIAVADDGPGVAPADRDRVLGRGESHNGGSGLGLAIVCDLLAPYGAALTLSDRNGGGLVAAFDLPL